VFRPAAGAHGYGRGPCGGNLAVAAVCFAASYSRSVPATARPVGRRPCRPARSPGGTRGRARRRPRRCEHC